MESWSLVSVFGNWPEIFQFFAPVTKKKAWRVINGGRAELRARRERLTIDRLKKEKVRRALAVVSILLANKGTNYGA
jgi:hypothetical protein